MHVFVVSRYHIYTVSKHHKYPALEDVLFKTIASLSYGVECQSIICFVYLPRLEINTHNEPRAGEFVIISASRELDTKLLTCKRLIIYLPLYVLFNSHMYSLLRYIHSRVLSSRDQAITEPVVAYDGDLGNIISLKCNEMYTSIKNMPSTSLHKCWHTGCFSLRIKRPRKIRQFRTRRSIYLFHASKARPFVIHTCEL